MALITATQPHMELNRSHIDNYTIRKYEGNKVGSFSMGISCRKRCWQDMNPGQCIFNGFQPFTRKKAVSARPSRMMVYNAYVGREAYSDKVYRRSDSRLVISPPNGMKPRAIIKFLGGAFVGAVPEVTYSHLIELLAKEGYLIISVPYNATFDHAEAVRTVYERFNACLDMVLTSGLPHAQLRAEDLSQLPLYSVGHSNGALLQLLMGSYFSEKLRKFGPLVSQMVPVIEASPMYPMARSVSGDVWKTVFDNVGAIIKEYNEGALITLNNFVGQLPSVMNQVTQGVSEFKPTPAENRDCFKNSHNIPHTLLVKFDSDAIDETDLVEEILKPRVQSVGGTLEKVSLSGNHLTPCIQDLRWQVGYAYTPLDALAQGLKALSLNDTRILAGPL